MMTHFIDRKPQVEDITADKRHIVIVEDDATVAMALQIRLESYFRLTLFRTAEEALYYIEKNHQTTDLMILDYRLAGHMTGLELLSIIRQISHLKFLPVILQSADDKSILNKVIAQPDAYIQKPWKGHNMLDAIAAVLHWPTPSSGFQRTLIS